MRTLLKRALTVAVLLLGTAAPASAQTFLGADMTFHHDFPSLGNHLATNNFVVGPGVEAPLGYSGLYSVDVGANTILIDFTGTSSWSPASFNGAVLRDTGANDVPNILGATLTSTNLVGFNASRVTFDAQAVYLNFQGLSFDPSRQILVTVDFEGGAAAVPEPISLALFAPGLAVVGFLKRRKKGEEPAEA
jgi:hypothetical protein